MNTTRLGRTNLTVPVCGFGGIPVGRDPADDEQGAEIIRRAIDAGITLIDTFCAYGRSEARIGMALKGRRDRVTLVTKSRARFERAEFLRMTEEALARMQVECIDVLLLKNVDNAESLARVQDNVAACEPLIRQGKVRFLGLSSHSPEHSCAAIETGLIAVAEVPYNYANRNFEPVLDLAQKRDVGILAMKPLGGGRLFPDGAVKGSPATLDTLVAALSFSMSHPVGPVLIPGIGTAAELDRYLEAIPRLRRLTDSERAALAKKAESFGDDYCRACGYCRAVCPAGIPIDEILPLLDRMKHVRTDETFRDLLRRQFRQIGLVENPCRECRKCLEECPFKLPVPERLKEAFEVFAPKKQS